MRYLIAFSLMASFGCNKKDDAADTAAKGKPGDTSTPTETATATETAEQTSTGTATETETASETETATETAATGVLALGESEAVQVMGAALVSAATVEDANGASLNPGTLALQTGLTQTEDCKASGTPNIPDVNDLTAGQVAALNAYCDLSKHPDGPDTTLGGIDRVQGILCALGEIEYDGQPRNVDLKITTECFSDTFVEMLQEMCAEDASMCPDGIPTFPHVVTASKLEDDEGKGFEKLILIEVPEGKQGFAYNVKLVQSEEHLAASVYDPDGGADDGLVFGIALVFGSPATIRYEGRFTRLEGDGGQNWRRHLRVRAVGALDDKTKAFTSLTDLQYVFWDTDAANGSGKFMSVQGSPADGFRAVGLDAGEAFDVSQYAFTIPGDKTVCYGSGDCTGNDGIAPKTEADLGFVKSLVVDDAAFIDFSAWFANHGPLSYETITLEAEQD